MPRSRIVWWGGALFPALCACIASGAESYYGSSPYSDSRQRRLSSGSTGSPAVVYVSLDRSITADLGLKGNVTTQLFKYITRSDDTPYEEVVLPKPFPFFGQDADRLYASPNGALHLSKAPPCESGVFSSPGCYASSYSGVIAPLFADFNPGAFPTSNITLTTSEDATIVVEYQNITELGQPETTSRVFDFDVVLKADGSIYFQWRLVPSMASVALTSWTSTIRPLDSQGSYVVTTEQRAIGRNEWESNTTGVYPSIANVTSGRETLFCPVSTAWCLTPSVAYSTLPPSHITLAPASLSCENDIEYAYYVVGSRETTMTACNVLSSQVLNCSGSGIAAVIVGKAQLQLQVTWRAKGKVSYSDLSAAPLTMLVTTSVPPASPYALASTNNCTVNGAFCADSPCDFCNQNFTCLDLPCTTVDYSDALNPTTIPDLYRDMSCENTCSTLFEVDRNGVCCLADDLDCAGTCNGTAAVGLTELGGEYICCTGIVDCLGVCNGPALFDTCGVCRSPGEEFSVCPTYFTVDTGYPDYAMHAYYPLSVQDNEIVSGTFESVIAFNNTNSTEVTFTMTLFGDDPSKAPAVQVPTVTYTVPAFSTIYVKLNSTIEDLLNGNASAWESKAIRIRYSRPAVFTYEIVVDANLLPNAKNCALLNGPSMCVDIPGCIYCYKTEGYRVLHVVGDQSVVDGAGSELPCDSITDSACPPTAETQRTLFGNVIPGSVNGNKGEDAVSGVCSDGWLTSDCTVYSYESQEPGIDPDTVGHVVIFSVLFGFVFASTYLFYSL